MDNLFVRESRAKPEGLDVLDGENNGEREKKSIKNFKKFRGNKMAVLARRRAVSRHVEFDIAVHDSLAPPKEWLQELNRDCQVRVLKRTMNKNRNLC